MTLPKRAAVNSNLLTPTTLGFRPDHRKWELRQLMESLTSLHRPNLPASLAFLRGRTVHDLIIKNSFDSELFLINNLLSVYVMCGGMAEALCLFQGMAKKNVISWTSIISGFAQLGLGEKAFDLFFQMQEAGIKPNQVTFVSLLSACSNSEFLTRGKLIHFVVVENAWESHVIVSTALIRMYCNGNILHNVESVFKNSPSKDIVSWTIMISGYVKCELCYEAIDLFGQMQREGMLPNQFTFNIIINACANIPSLEEGQRIHACLMQTSYQNYLFIENALLDMYAKCGDLGTAHRLFTQMSRRDLVSWNAMITAFAQHDSKEEVFRHFEKLKLEGFTPDQFTYSCLLSVCASLGNLHLGMMIHDEIKHAGLEVELPVVNALLDMYTKCGCMLEAHKLFDRMEKRDEVTWTTMVTGCVQKMKGEEAYELFDQMPRRDVLSWTAMIQGYVQHGHYDIALEFFLQMQAEGVHPNHITFGTVICACAGLLDLEMGREIHTSIIREGLQSDLNIGNSLIDMYSRCGSLTDACSIFNGMLKRDAVSWNVMISCCADHGDGKEAFDLSRKMEYIGVKPDEFTVSSILSACRHAGLINEACFYLIHMLRSYDIMPSVHHCASIVDLLGRIGCLCEASDFLNRIPFQPNIVLLVSFLSACKSHADTELAEQFSDEMLILGPENAGVHVLLHNIFSGKNMPIDEDEGSDIEQQISY